MTAKWLWFFKDKYYAPKSSQKCVFGLMNFGHYKHQSRLLTNEYQQQLVSRSNPDIQYSITQTTTTLSRGILKPKWWLKSVSTLDSRKKRKEQLTKMEMNQENSQTGSIEMQKCSICKEFVPRFDIRYVWLSFISFETNLVKLRLRIKTIKKSLIWPCWIIFA